MFSLIPAGFSYCCRVDFKHPDILTDLLAMVSCCFLLVLLILEGT
ncbi:hypothetical protein ACP43V_16800 [Vibrio genomosp. F10 str. 9ZC157]|nr:hypothetical protein [Vibrio genomosp. F10]